MSEKWPAIALAVLGVRLLLLLLLDAVSGTHALDQSCEADDDAAAPTTVCGRVLYLH